MSHSVHNPGNKHKGRRILLFCLYYAESHMIMTLAQAVAVQCVHTNRLIVIERREIHFLVCLCHRLQSTPNLCPSIFAKLDQPERQR